MKRGFLLSTAALGLGLGLGLWWWSAPETASEPTSPVRAGAVARSNPPPAPPAALATQLERARAATPPGELREHLIALLVAAAQADPAAAVQAALSLSDEEGRAEALHECLPLWIGSDKAAARDFLLAQVGVLPLELVQALARDAAELDPQLGLALARQVHVSARPRVVREVFSAWAGRAPRAAAEATRQLLESDGQVRAVGEVARIWGEQSPADAQGWAVTLETPALRREALLPIVSSWSAHDPQRAAEAVSALSDEGYKQRLVDTVASQWADKSPDAAQRWVSALTPPALREAGATALALRLLEREPARAASWALALGGDAQSELVEKTLTSWSARDPQAALAWARAQSGSQAQALLALVHERVGARGVTQE